ncbi:SET domain-containing protein SmydA-8, isoform A [Frankliniella fusca]|uniref:SET domain-containing protein SmydA-8, isoform A n=1 Tax=Frankliniella fusca TaxID=407009 RepID=A0AAE1LMA1_9NEOP|nr:SET domain-containing protein SmydA-8, isoform A [Frankliniella fusca]
MATTRRDAAIQVKRGDSYHEQSRVTLSRALVAAGHLSGVVKLQGNPTTVQGFDILTNDKYGRKSKFTFAIILNRLMHGRDTDLTPVRAARRRRYAVASRDLPAGEVLVSELPFAVGPKLDTYPLCLGCLAPVDASAVCSACGWPVCDPDCERLPLHADNECAVFKAAGVRFALPAEPGAAAGTCPQYECITPLRVLLAKEKDPARWEREVKVLMTHSDKRKANPQWGANQVNVVDFLRKRCKLEERFSEDAVHEVIGILEVNGYEARTPSGAMVLCLYPQAAIMAHNCVPNTVHCITPTNTAGERYRIVVRAATAVAKGSELYTSYAHTLDPTMLRREHLKLSKFFDCDCARCADPTELGTHMSSLKCTKCDNGIILSTGPLDPGAEWKCNGYNCSNALRADQVRRVLAVVQAEQEAVDQGETGDALALGPVEAREKLLKQYKTVFHPRHALLLQLKHSLAQLYGRVDGYALDDLPDILLERKIELCKEILSALAVVAPGMSRVRGLTLYELHVPMILLARSRFQTDQLSESQLRQELTAAAKVLTEAADILCLEDPTTPEGSVGAMARESLVQLQASIDSLPV